MIRNHFTCKQIVVLITATTSTSKLAEMCLEKMLHNTTISKIGTIAFGGKLDPCIQQETVQNNAIVLCQFALLFRTL
jgi:hypothetical protein